MCGDGYLDFGEECDDGNLVDDDGCSSACETEFFERDYACGDGCLETTIVSASVPLLHTNTITYAFNKTTDDTCDVSHFVLFDIPNCTNVIAVTSYPLGCATEVFVPCNAAGDPRCTRVGPCAEEWDAFIGRPMKVDIWGNNCSVTITFANNLTFTEAPFGVKGGKACSNCTVLVPESCYEPVQITPEFMCWWDFDNTTCAAVYNYALSNAMLAIVPKGTRNFVSPNVLPNMDNTPTVFTEEAQTMGHSAYWDCHTFPTQTWKVDGATAVASKSTPSMVCDDCNDNSVPDPVDIERHTSADCNFNCIPDECDIARNVSKDNNTNGIPDECEMAGMTPSPPPGYQPSLAHGAIIIIIVLAVCVAAGCCAFFVSRKPNCDDDSKDAAHRERCKRENDPLWADASVSRRGPGGARGTIGLGMSMHTDTDRSETDGHRKKI